MLWAAVGLAVVLTTTEALLGLAASRFHLPSRLHETASLFVLVIIVGFAELLLYQHVSAARIAAGTGTFILGLAIRYSFLIPRLFRTSEARALWGEQTLQLEAFLNVRRRPTPIGSLLQCIGLALILSSVAAGVVALVMPAVIVVAARRAEDDRRSRQGPDYFGDERPVLPLRPAAIALLIGPSTALYLLVAFLSNEVGVFASDVETARTLVLALAGAQGTIGILTLTLMFVLVQVTAGSYAGSLGRLIWSDSRLWLAYGFLLGSIGLDVLLIARTGTWLTADGMLVDLALLAAACSLSLVVYLSLSSVRILAPERLIRRALAGLDKEYLSETLENWASRFGPQHLESEDPMRAAESVLRGLIARQDIQSFILALIVVRDTLSTHSRGLPLVQLQSYCHHYLGPLLSSVERNLGSEGLQQFLDFVENVPAPSPQDWVDNKHLTSWESPPGEALLRRTISVAIGSNHETVILRGLFRVEERAKRFLAFLPAAEETAMYNPDYDYSKSHSAEDRQRRWGEEAKVEVFERQYIGYFADICDQAIIQNHREVCRDATNGLATMINEACRNVSSQRIRETVVNHGLYRFNEVSKTAAEHSREAYIDMSSLHLDLNVLGKDSENTLLLKHIAVFAAGVLTRIAAANVLDTGLVVDVAMIGLYGDNTKSGAGEIVTEAMCHILDALASAPNDPQQEKAESLMRVLRSRIEQVGFASGEKARAMAETALKMAENRS